MQRLQGTRYPSTSLRRRQLCREACIDVCIGILIGFCIGTVGRHRVLTILRTSACFDHFFPLQPLPSHMSIRMPHVHGLSTCPYAYLYACLSYMHASTCFRTHACPYFSTCLCIRLRTSLCTYLRTCLCTFISTDLCTYVRTHARTHCFMDTGLGALVSCANRAPYAIRRVFLAIDDQDFYRQGTSRCGGMG